jgi:hypothetical protein
VLLSFWAISSFLTTSFLHDADWPLLWMVDEQSREKRQESARLR